MKAFPNGIITNDKGVIVGGQQGMDLRDWFAGIAMQAMLPTYDVPLVFDDDTEGEDGSSMPELIAKDAYIMADVMMKAREQK
jgi:hypothetical protein